MPAMIAKTYDPADIERRMSAAWEDAQAFAAGQFPLFDHSLSVAGKK